MPEVFSNTISNANMPTVATQEKHNACIPTFMVKPTMIEIMSNCRMNNI